MAKRIFLVLNCFFSITLFSQNTNRDFYFSWGYNKEWYTNSNIHIEQGELGNDLVFENTQAHDNIGWDKAFTRDLTVPQYSYRMGYFYNPDWAFEINFDHTKYTVANGQTLRINGTLNYSNVDSNIVVDNNNFWYLLNNGANFLLFNIVRKINLYDHPAQKIRIDALLKVGVGPTIPHVSNTIFGNDNVPHFQIGGWNAGVESTIKITFFKYAFLEYCIKGDYARYFGLRLYKGTSHHAFGTFEMIANLGINIPINNKQATASAGAAAGK